VAVLPDEPGPIQWAPLGSVLGLTNSAAEPSEDQTNEWGFYDPDLAGFGALMTTLDTTEIPVPDEVEEDPGDLLLRQQDGTAAAPTGAFEPDSPFDMDGTPRPSPAAVAVASCRVGHLSPLSLWARVAEGDTPAPMAPRPDTVGRLLAQWMPKKSARAGSPFASSDLAAQIGRLTHPAHVATTSLSPVCRIRGIRVAPVVVVTEPAEELAGWPQPNVIPLPEAVTVEALESAVAKPAEAADVPPAPGPAEPQPAPALDVPAPSPDAAAPPPVEFVQAESDFGTDAPADLEVATVVPPELDALPIDFITAAPPVGDVASLETVSFDRLLAPPIEFDVATDVPPASDESFFGPVGEPAADPAPALEIQIPDAPTMSAAGGVSLEGPPAGGPPSVVPDPDAEEADRAEQRDPQPSVALSDAAPEEPAAVVVDPQPAIRVVPFVPSAAAAAPARKRRRAAMALG
jgi:hypothetical protein